jgi:hypothetical protein
MMNEDELVDFDDEEKSEREEAIGSARRLVRPAPLPIKRHRESAWARRAAIFAGMFNPFLQAPREPIYVEPAVSQPAPRRFYPRNGGLRIKALRVTGGIRFSPKKMRSKR